MEQEFRAQLTFLKAMGAKVIGASEQSYSVQGQQDTPIFGHKYVMNDAEWETFCTGMNKLGKIAKEEYGIALTFHHHMGTVVQTAEEVERMMANTDPEYVSLLFDTGHFAYCGEDPLAMVKKYVSRIKHVHLKDIRPEVVEQVKAENLSFLDGVRLGTFTIPGDGCIDFDPIFQVLEEAGYEGYMLVEAEQDPAKSQSVGICNACKKIYCRKNRTLRRIETAASQRFLHFVPMERGITMALVAMKELLKRAEEKNVGCGAFSVGNMEMVRGAVQAAEERQTPIILQIAEVRLGHSPLNLMGPMMIQAAKDAFGGHCGAFGSRTDDEDDSAGAGSWVYFGDAGCVDPAV